MSQNSLGNLEYHKFNGKEIKTERLRLRDDAESSAIAQAVIKLEKTIQEISDRLNSFMKFYDADNVVKSNSLIKKIPEITQASANTVINTVTSGGSGGGSVSTSDITTVSVALVGGVATPQVFSAPATLVSIPIGYTTFEGVTSAEILAPTSLTVTGFTITSLQSCTAVYSYKLL
jgi:hypothetical protein